jgi:hypothetical protein
MLNSLILSLVLQVQSATHGVGGGITDGDAPPCSSPHGARIGVTHAGAGWVGALGGLPGAGGGSGSKASKAPRPYVAATNRLVGGEEAQGAD